jgi:hypothetical protein
MMVQHVNVMLTSAAISWIIEGVLYTVAAMVEAIERIDKMPKVIKVKIFGFRSMGVNLRCIIGS